MGGVKPKSKPTLHCTWHIGSPPKYWQDNAPFLGGGYNRQVFFCRVIRKLQVASFPDPSTALYTIS